MQPKRHSTLFLCLIVAMLVSTALSSLVVRRCVSGKTYFDGCNNCHCSTDGYELCTLKLCTFYDENLKEEVQLPKQKAPADFWEPLRIVEPPHA